ncbi:MAG: DUF2089 domain-containing protein [Anaerolineae bacterium]|nr:DUF2089 domain-containing protein [Anaerolineae bacterium]MDW8102318.1 DUF2089 domain-containing protein [Anaerolineae bacterium]
MRRVIGNCPVCGTQMVVKALRCPGCGTVMEGNFDLGRLYRLNPEQIQFVEIFLRCEGKLNRVQEMLGISYPTARARLLEVIKALGYEVKEEAQPTPEERKTILEELDQGKITVEEAIRRLRGSVSHE